MSAPSPSRRYGNQSGLVAATPVIAITPSAPVIPSSGSSRAECQGSLHPESLDVLLVFAELLLGADEGGALGAACVSLRARSRACADRQGQRSANSSTAQAKRTTDRPSSSTG